MQYPIKFKPIQQERIWGGEKLHRLFGKPKRKEPIGESWEISAIAENVSVVANGSLKGKNLQELINAFKAEFVGDKVYKKFGEKFPLLVKFIDAKTDLSIQLHPNDSLAQKRHNSFGKEEMWYIMHAEKDSRLLFGFNQDLTKDAYLKHLKNKTLTQVLHEEKVQEANVYHIPSGRVHAIGGGVVLAEIQQSSDITYRLYDWDRKNVQGKVRELHTDLALDAIDFKIPETYKTVYTSIQNKSNPVISSKYFTTKIVDLNTVMDFQKLTKDSFTIYMCVAGSGSFSTNESAVEIKTGETIFIPAILQKYKIIPAKESLRLLQISV